MLRCPNCGQKLEVVRPPLTGRQRLILEAIEALRRDLDDLPTSRTIAVRVNIPSATVRVDLRVMEEGHHVHRPHGPNSGYEAATDEDIRLIAVRNWAA